jgi:hypothetical protein
LNWCTQTRPTLLLHLLCLKAEDFSCLEEIAQAAQWVNETAHVSIVNALSCVIASQCTRFYYLLRLTVDNFSLSNARWFYLPTGDRSSLYILYYSVHSSLGSQFLWQWPLYNNCDYFLNCVCPNGPCQLSMWEETRAPGENPRLSIARVHCL